jgi:GTP-binding protein
VACLIMDASQPVAEQDAKVASLAIEAGRGIVLVFTKADLLPRHPTARRKLREEVADKLQFVSYAPILFLSSQTGVGVGRLLPTARRVYVEAGKRVPTAELNRFLESAVTQYAPPSSRGRQVRFYYMVQPETRPPTFLCSTNLVEGVHFTYRRYLANRLRERYGFEGTPLRLFFRQRGKRDER